MPDSSKDYYQTLGVARTATLKEINAAFRKLARQHHPDKNPNDKAAEDRFKAINEAKEILTDPQKRKAYDTYGADWENYQRWVQAGHPGDAYPGSNPRSTARSSGSSGSRPRQPIDLGSLFGSNGADFTDYFDILQPRPRRGANLEGELSISLTEAYLGTTRTLDITTPAGRRQLQLSIPAGISHGATLRAAGQGEKGDAGSGDVLVAIKISPHPQFQRQGDNLQTTLSVPLKTILLGGTMSVPTLKGGRVELKIPPATQNQGRLRLKGQGMPILNSKTFGDLIIDLQVQLPIPLSAQNRQAIEQLESPPV